MGGQNESVRNERGESSNRMDNKQSLTFVVRRELIKRDCRIGNQQSTVSLEKSV